VVTSGNYPLRFALVASE